MGKLEKEVEDKSSFEKDSLKEEPREEIYSEMFRKRPAPYFNGGRGDIMTNRVLYRGILI